MAQRGGARLASHTTWLSGVECPLTARRASLAGSLHRLLWILTGLSADLYKLLQSGHRFSTCCRRVTIIFMLVKGMYHVQLAMPKGRFYDR